MNDWKSHTFTMENKFRALEAHYNQLLAANAERNNILRKTLEVAYEGMKHCLTLADVPSIQVHINTVIDKVMDDLERQAPSRTNSLKLRPAQDIETTATTVADDGTPKA
jgi:hypothetical protein